MSIHANDLFVGNDPEADVIVSIFHVELSIDDNNDGDSSALNVNPDTDCLQPNSGGTDMAADIAQLTAIITRIRLADLFPEIM